MTVDLRPLALEAGASPSPNIRIDAGPDEVVLYQSLCCSDSWVGERVEHVKDGATELFWNVWTLHTCGNITDDGDTV